MEATNSANKGTFGDDRRVIIPKGYTFSMMPTCKVTELKDIEIVIDGNILLSKNIYDYPLDGHNPHLFEISDSTNLTVRGSGEIDG